MKTNKKLINTILLVFSLSGFSVSGANAQTHCYRFNSPPVGTIFSVGESLRTNDAVVNFLQLKDSVNIGHARISDSNIIDNAQPSLSVSNGGAAKIQFVPRRRIQSVTMRYAESVPQVDNPQGWNLGMNNKLLKWKGRLSDQDGVRIGKANFGGRVLITVQEEPNAPSHGWVEGTLTLKSDPNKPGLSNRGIGIFEIGRTSTLLLDDICLTF